MDSFEDVLGAASQRTQEGEVSFEDALLSVLSAEEPIESPPAEQDGPDDAAGDLQSEPPDAVYRVPVVTLDHLTQVIQRLVPVQVDAVLAKDSWQEPEGESGLYTYRFENPVFASHKRTEMYVSMACADDAASADIYPITDTRDGYVIIQAQRLPASDLAVTFLVRVIRRNITYAKNTEEA